MKAEPRALSELEKRLDLAHHLPRLRLVALLLALLVAIALWGWAIPETHRSGWSAGPLTNHHRLVEPSCERCHPAAFGGAPDGACVSCHAVHEHVAAAPAVVKSHPELESRCSACHREHHGEENLMPAGTTLCTNCHRQIGELAPKSRQPSIASFAGHPEFTIEAWAGDPPALRRVAVGESGMRPSALKFSHALHLDHKPAAGQAALGCSSCHAVGADGQDLAPVSFERHCQSCHPLDFDDRLPSARVPHGASDQVFTFVRAEVARFHLERGAGKVARGLIERESRDDEAGLFSEGAGCMKCHDVRGPRESGGDAPRYRVVMRQRSRWMPAALFEHGAHRFSACEDCHAGIAASRSTGDLVMPSIEVCRQCHADPGTPGKVESPCVQCHQYHPRKR